MTRGAEPQRVKQGVETGAARETGGGRRAPREGAPEIAQAVSASAGTVSGTLSIRRVAPRWAARAMRTR